MPITHPKVSAIADDPVAVSNGEVVPSDWNAAHAVDYLTLTHGTITAAQPTLDATATWNNGAVAFTGWKYNVTDTASAAGSLLADLQVGGVSKASIKKDGSITSAYQVLAGTSDKDFPGLSFADNPDTGWYWNGGVFGIAFNGLRIGYCNSAGIFWWDASFGLLSNTGSLEWGDGDAKITREGVGIIGQRDAGVVSAQTYRVYGTYTDASNYVRASLGATSTAVTLAAETAGTGADDVDLTLTPAGVGVVVSGRPIKTQVTTVGALTAAATVGAGARAFVTDATVTTFASIAAGGGANGVPVYSDGTNWRIG